MITINKNQLKYIGFLLCTVLLATWLHHERKIIRFAFKHNMPCVLWTKQIKTNADTLNIVASLLPNNPVVVEAGAYNGLDSARLASFWPSGTIHCFEPIPELYAQVVENTQKYSNVHTYTYALADHNGTADFYVSSFDNAQDIPSESSSLLAPKEHLTQAPNVIFKKKIQVQTITLDQWAQKYNIDHIDFMWLDTQGCELLILQQASKLLPTVKAILAEVSFVEAYKDQPLFNELKTWMEKQGFKLAGMHYGCSWNGDALFIRNNLL